MEQLRNNRSMWVIRGFVLVAVTALLSGCSSAPPTAPIVSGINDTGIKAGSVADTLATTWTEVASVWVNKGEAKSVSGSRYTMAFARGSLASGAQVTISELDPTMADCKIGPNGTILSKPATLTISYAGTSMELFPTQIKLWRFNESTAAWEQVSATNDLLGRSLSAKVSVLGRYTLDTQPPGKAGW